MHSNSGEVLAEKDPTLILLIRSPAFISMALIPAVSFPSRLNSAKFSSRGANDRTQARTQSGPERRRVHKRPSLDPTVD